MTKFKVGDRVRIINYGHEMYYGKQGYQAMHEWLTDEPMPSLVEVLLGIEPKKPEPLAAHPVYKPKHIISETDTMYIADMSPELVGQVGIVTEAHTTQGIDNYSLKGPAKTAWYHNPQLELA